MGPTRQLRRRVHPVGWVAPVAGSVITVLAWAGVAHSSGSGWVQAIGALLAAVLLTGLVAPLFPALRARARCTRSPADGEAGRTVVVTLVTSGPVRIRPRRPVGPTTRAGGPARGRREVEVSLTPAHRGVVDSIAVELASCAPFGILWWAREVEIPLTRPLHVAPRSGPAADLETRPDTPPGDAPQRLPSGVGDPRGVRPYQAGDTRRSVHWPATSHVGSLMVREKERSTDDPIVVDLVLPVDPAAAEAEAGRAMTALGHHLARGGPVVLGTDEVDGHTVRAVRDRIDLGRRLARAVPRPGQVPPAPPAGGRRSRRRRAG
jgi:uncharacterized protein (DUF58 family)